MNDEINRLLIISEKHIEKLKKNKLFKNQKFGKISGLRNKYERLKVIEDMTLITSFGKMMIIDELNMMDKCLCLTHRVLSKGDIYNLLYIEVERIKKDLI